MYIILYNGANNDAGRGGSVVGFGAWRPEGRRFESYLAAIGKFFTRSCLLRFGVLILT